MFSWFWFFLPTLDNIQHKKDVRLDIQQRKMTVKKVSKVEANPRLQEGIPISISVSISVSISISAREGVYRRSSISPPPLPAPKFLPALVCPTQRKSQPKDMQICRGTKKKEAKMRKKKEICMYVMLLHPMRFDPMRITSS